MRQLMYLQAINEAFAEELERDEKVFLIGEGIQTGTFGTTTGLVDRFGPERIMDSPLAETAIAMLIAQARYEGGYWNTTGIARHVTTRGLLKEMNQRGIDVLVHGATGRGNDQVRFQLVANMLKPTVSVYAPWRDSAYLDQFGGRKEMIDFCNLHNLPITASYEKPYSTDANFLGLTHEAGQLESLEIAADYIEPGMGVFPAQAPDEPELFTVRLEK
ncbi:MAG: hypothetical protein HOB38_02430, partial [Deltaproteobacteria bacterium]|nr:hypothetical protein [Deltaproteobacteria bacterium]